jgi:hypothetical protein
MQDKFTVRTVVGFLLFLLCGYVCAGQTGRVDPIGPPTDADIPQPVKSILETTGRRITLDDGAPACEIWLRKSVPVQTKKDLPNVLYPELAESVLVGLISLPHAAIDYRGQTVKAGAYTLRYELIPEDGNHLGVAANRDFVLLVPAASDPDPNAKFSFAELVNLSRKATGTRHPGPLSLVQAGGATSLSKDEEEHWIFSTILKLESGKELPFALVVKGTAPQ